MIELSKYLAENSYPGRGIIVGKTKAGEGALAYFIMGRSENSRNRVFVCEDGTLRTQAFDASKVTDPTLIIYNAVRSFGTKTIVTNGDQTDTIYQLMDKQYSFEQSLRGRQFEPDAPNFTPRISAVLHSDDGEFNYAISILKHGEPDGEKTPVSRLTYSYSNPAGGYGHFIHTYESDGDPLPSFEGEPRQLSIPGSIDDLANGIWNSLNNDNKVALYVRYICPKTCKYDERIINKWTK